MILLGGAVSKVQSKYVVDRHGEPEFKLQKAVSGRGILQGDDTKKRKGKTSLLVMAA
jgi:hypothetical protein